MSQKSARKARVAAKTPPPVGKGRAQAIPRSWLYGGGALLVVVVVVAIVLATTLGGGSEEAPLTVDGTRTAQLLDGIPQDGIALGSPDAPVVLVEFGDLQCPFCAEAATQALPEIIVDYVRPGDVQLVFRGIAFIGPDSEKALRAALSAGEQDRFWNVLDLLYHHQGGENDGWVTDSLLRAIGAAVPGLDVDAMMGGLDSDAVDSGLASGQAEADKAGVRSTPTFFVGERDGTLQQIELTELRPEPIAQALDEALGR